MTITRYPLPGSVLAPPAEEYNIVTQGGADPTGTKPADAAFAKAITAVLGTADPASNTRNATLPIYLPPGKFKITTDIPVLSSSGFWLKGAGQGITELVYSGTGFTNAGLYIDGSSTGTFSDMTILGDGTEQVPAVIQLTGTTAASRTTTRNTFRNVQIRNLKFVTGIDCSGSGTRQLDGTVFINTLVTGGQSNTTWSQTGNWQNAYLFGNGSAGNNYDHVGFSMGASGCFTGYNVNQSSLMVIGAQPTNNFQDFQVNAFAQCTFRNIQSQNASRFIVGPSQFLPSPISIEDSVFKTSFLNADFKAVMIAGGQWNIRNLDLSRTVIGSVHTPALISITGPTTGRPASVELDNVSINGPMLTQVVPAANLANVSVRNYRNYNPDTAVYTLASGELLSTYTGGAWVPLSPP